MSAKSIGRQNMVILVVLLAGQLFLMSGSVRGAKGAATLERWMMRLTSPVVVVAEAAGGAVGGAAGTLRELVTARARTQVLEAHVRRLSTEVRAFREADGENRRLRLLLGMKETLVPRSVAGSVVTSNVTGQSRMIVVDRGSRDGVRADQPVVTWGGAVGRVVATAGGHAKVRLLTDPSSGVAGVLQRSRAQGIVFGTADAGLELRFVPRFSDVAHGDRVVTSGLAGIFPRGFGVGRVTSIRQAADGTQTIELDPELNFAEIEEVLVVLETPEGGALEEPDSGARAMTPIRALLGLTAALALQVALGRIWPEIHAYVDLLLVPVALYGASGTQRSAMLVGCLSGLLHDTWFQAGTFGITAFRWTLLGWAVGSVASWLDLGHGGGRFLVGAGLALADNLVDPMLLRLLDLPPRSHGVGALILQVVITGLLTASVGRMVDRGKQTGPGMRADAWRRMA